MVDDIRRAADLFLNLYETSKCIDGYVSIEVNPNYANNTDQTILEAKRLWTKINRPNIMIKIPATREGLPAITKVIAEGINVNVTLIFSTGRYIEVIDAYLSGLEERLQAGLPIDKVHSVASFFISRINSKIDPLISAYRGK